MRDTSESPSRAFADLAGAATASRRRSLTVVLSTTAGVGLIFGFQPPLVAFILERGGASSFEVGCVTSASVVAVIALGPLYPRLISQLGLRLAIALSTGIAILALLAMPVFVTVPSWLALRFATGCALGLGWVATEVWLNRLATDADRGTIMGAYSTIFAVGVVAGPLLLQFTGTAGWRPFTIGALGLALTAAPLVAIRHVPPADADRQTPGRLLGMVRAAPVVMTAALVAGLVESADLSLLPLFGLHNALDERASLLLVTVFLTGNVLLQLPIGRLADSFGRRSVLAGCAAVSTIGPLLLFSALSHPLLLWPLLFVWGGTLYGFYTQGIALLGESFMVRDLPAANTVFIMVYCAGGFLGPSVAGLAMDVWRSGGLVGFVSAAAFLIIVALAAERRPRTK